MDLSQLTTVEEVNAQIDVLRRHRDTLQQLCAHPGADREFKYRSDTGNWDKSQDCYWIEISCPHCKKRWSLDNHSWAYRAPREAILPVNN